MREDARLFRTVAFRNLLLNTAFTRTFGSMYRHGEHLDTYSAYIRFPESRPNLHIQAVGNQAFSVMEWSNGWMLIRDADWEENLLRILEQTD